MREIVVISGKGGTGKTTVTAALAHLASDPVICDLDVDAPDLHIILDPSVRQSSPFMSGNHARVREKDCVGCGRCAELCAFDAVSIRDGHAAVRPFRCEGCGVCVRLCPAQALDFPERHCGDWHVSDTRFGVMVHAQLFPGQESSGKLVGLLKAEARKIAKEEKKGFVLCDGSPGVGCPVIASLSGADIAVGVVEPTPSGRHDFLRIEELCRHFRIPLAVIINKADLNEEESRAIAAHCEEKGLVLAGSLPFDPCVTRAMVARRALTEIPSALGPRLEEIWSAIQAMKTPREIRAAQKRS